MTAAKFSPTKARRIAAAILAWYDERARDLPWRIGPKARARGERPDPYAVWLSEIMLQQTTVATVAPRYRAFLERWPDIGALAGAPLEEVLGEWAGLGYYSRARNLHKCARAVVEECGGAFPQDEAALRRLPGVGDYTAAAIAAIAFDAPAIVMDGNIERVTARLFAIETPLPKAKPELKAAIGSLWPAQRSGDFAQALMDLGASICSPRAPACEACPLAAFCRACASGAPEQFPQRAVKKPKPTRYGAGFALFDGAGRVLVERRPEKGLLGGMLGLPCTEWIEERRDTPWSEAPMAGDWRHAGLARHSFTHFHLELDVFVGAGAPRRLANGAEWAEPATVRLPTVMRKALDVALRARAGPA